MSRDPLPAGHILYPAGDSSGAGYQIVRQIGSGGFGVTYEAVKLAAHGGADRSAGLGLAPMSRVAVKEFFPDEIAQKQGSRLVPVDEDGAAEMFDRALHRFRREAERLYFLTQLRAVRAILASADRDRIEPDLRRGLEGFATGAVVDIAGVQRLIDRAGESAAARARVGLAGAPLPTVYDYFNTPFTAYYVMEFLEGGTLKDRIQARRKEYGTETIAVAGRNFRLIRPWPEAAVRAFAAASLDALDELHNGIGRQQLIHCDLKPGNIMFRSIGSDAPVLIDFGLTRDVASDASRSTFGGSTGFSPLEIDVDYRVHGNSVGGTAMKPSAVGPWTDIYSLAVVLRILATGIEGTAVPSAYVRYTELRVGEADPMAALPPYPPGFSARLARGIDAGLMLAASDRPQSIAAWREALGVAAPRTAEVQREASPVWRAAVSAIPPEATRSSAGGERPRPPVVEPSLPGPSPRTRGVSLTRNHAIAALIVVSFVVLLVYALPALLRDERAAEPANSVSDAPAIDAAIENSTMIANVPPDAAPTGTASPTPMETPGIASPAPDSLDAPIAHAPSSTTPPPAAPQPVQEPILAPQVRRYEKLGLTVQTITDPSRLAGWRNSGMDPGDPVRVVGIDGSAPLVSDAVHMNDIFVSACGGGSTLRALSTANANMKSCVVTESESSIRFN